MDINTSFLSKKNNICEMTDLTALAIPKGIKVHVIAPHSDDFDINAVTLKHFEQNGAVIKLEVLSLDNGVEPDFEPQTPQSHIRKREQLESLAFFGFDMKMVNFVDTVCDHTGQSGYHEENIRILEDMVRGYDPDIIITPHPNDTNSAHKNVAGMLYSISVSKNIIIMHNLDPKTVSFRPDMYMPFDRNQALWKAEMLRFHRSQHSRNLNTRGYGFDQRLLELSRHAALEYKLDCDYAELFEMRELKS